MKKIIELKQGEKIYYVENFRVRWYKYLCVHPTGQGNYHILINECEEPERLYKTRLEELLNMDFKTHKEASIGLADMLEKKANELRQEDY